MNFLAVIALFVYPIISWEIRVLAFSANSFKLTCAGRVEDANIMFPSDDFRAPMILWTICALSKADDGIVWYSFGIEKEMFSTVIVFTEELPHHIKKTAQMKHPKSVTFLKLEASLRKTCSIYFTKI